MSKKPFLKNKKDKCMEKLEDFINNYSKNKKIRKQNKDFGKLFKKNKDWIIN